VRARIKYETKADGNHNDERCISHQPSEVMRSMAGKMETFSIFNFRHIPLSLQNSGYPIGLMWRKETIAIKDKSLPGQSDE
jgi:hypothetical protein